MIISSKTLVSPRTQNLYVTPSSSNHFGGILCCLQERVDALNDYVTVVKRLDAKGLELAHRLGVEKAIELIHAVNQAIEKETLTLPYKLSLPLWTEILLAKNTKK